VVLLPGRFFDAVRQSVLGLPWLNAALLNTPRKALFAVLPRVAVLLRLSTEDASANERRKT
jgi:hypothetical protein